MNRSLLVGGVLVIVALIAALFVVASSDDDGGGDGVAEAEGEILLEPVAFVGDDPFTGNLDDHNEGTTATTAPRIATTAPATPVSVAPSVAVSGATPGLYGGTRDEGACDPEQLIEFLMGDPDKAAAWADVQGITVAGIGDFVRSLTPVVLQRDTRVTNHGYRNGRATPLQSILQAGTAVLVDSRGVPRVKCGCGNPLVEPRRSAATYRGDRWPTFSPANVVVVQQSTVEVSVFVLVDVAGGEPITRPAGTFGAADGEVLVDELCDLYPEDETCGGAAAGPTTPTTRPGEPELGTGEVQVTLRWYSTADLDLAVTDPGGERIDYGNTSSSSGGSLDVDSNGGCADATTTPVENIFWPTGSAPDGQYLLEVTYFTECEGGTGAQAFELSFYVAGQPVAVQPAVFDADADGSLELWLDVADGRPSLLVPGTTQVVDGTVTPGATNSYVVDKEPGATPPGEMPTDEPAPPETQQPEGETPPGTDTPAAPTDPCAEYEEGTPMRILCEHDPTTNDVSGN